MFRQIDDQQHVRDILELYRTDQIDLEPPYQRLSVWSKEFKQYFIDTILRGFPVPALFFFKEQELPSKHGIHVVDGKQRLTAIFEFLEGKFTISSDPDDDLLGPWNRRKFSGLPKDLQEKFLDYLLIIEYIPSADEDLIDDIFDRINRNVAPLQAQELRNAKYHGVFSSQVKDSAQQLLTVLPKGKLPWLRPGQLSRMQDQELVAELFLLLQDGAKHTKAEVLNAAFDAYEKQWPQKKAIVDRFNRVIEYMKSLIGERHGGHSLMMSRLRNLTDFYPFFGAVDELLCTRSAGMVTSRVVQRLNTFIERVKDPNTQDPEAREYAKTVRGASNDARLRKLRQNMLVSVMSGRWDDKLNLLPMPIV